MKCIAKSAVMAIQREFLKSVERNVRRSIHGVIRRLFGAEAEMRMHHCAGSGYGSELACGPDKVQRPDDVSPKRHEGGTIKAEIKPAVRPLLELHPGRTILSWEAQGLARESWIHTDQRQQCSAAITGVDRQVTDFTRSQVKTSS